MSKAAASLGASPYTVRKLIKEGILPAQQVVADAPWQIRAADLQHPGVANGR